MQNVLVTGVTGQIGYYVASLLSRKGVPVYGLVRQTTKERTRAAAPLPYIPITGDLLDEYSLLSVLEQVRPSRIFNFGAQSFIPGSWTQPILTAQYTGLGVVRLLEVVRRVLPECRVLQAGSSDSFGGTVVSPQDENTPICPRNPYAIAKAFAFHTMVAYREHYKQFATNAIFYTNESPRRSPEFIFRKVTRAVAEIVAGKTTKLVLGNLDTVRDWGFAPEYAAIAIALLDHAVPGDFVVATGEGHRVRDLVQAAFALVDLDWQKYVDVDPNFVRPSEAAPLIGNPAKLSRELGLKVKVNFDALVRIMVAHDLELEGITPTFQHPGFDVPA